MIYSLCSYMFGYINFVVLAPPKGKKSNTGAIVGGVIGGILFLILIGVGVFFFLRWKSKYSFMLHSSKKVLWRSKARFINCLQSISENVTTCDNENGFQQVRLQFRKTFHNLTVFRKSRSHSKQSFIWTRLQNFTWENA